MNDFNILRNSNFKAKRKTFQKMMKFSILELLPCKNQLFIQESYNILKLTNSICTASLTCLPKRNKKKPASKIKVLAIEIQPSISLRTVTNSQGPSRGPLKDTRRYTQSMTNKTYTPSLKHPTSATTSWKDTDNNPVPCGISPRATSPSKINHRIKSSPTFSRDISREKRTTRPKCWEHSQR